MESCVHGFIVGNECHQCGGTALTIDLREQVKTVALRREEVRQIKEEVAALEADFRKQNEDLYEKLGQYVTALGLEEETLREIWLREYEETGDKHPAPGVEIKAGKILEYKLDDALELLKKAKIATPGH